MLMMLAIPFLLLAALVLPGSVARLAGLIVIALVVGLTWRAAMMGSLDVLLLLGGATMARRLGFAKPDCAGKARLVAMTFVGFIFMEFGVFALLIGNFTGDAVYALPFDLGLLLSGLTLAILATRSPKVSPISSPASLLAA